MTLAAVREAALLATRSGMSFVPPAEDGTKRPAFNWKEYQSRCPSEEEVRQWYPGGMTGRTGIGIVTGSVSGNLECLDFDDPTAFAEFAKTVDAAGLFPVLERIYEGYFEETPSGGQHILYRCAEIGGNQKLAQRPEHGEGGTRAVAVKTLIETRGEGGYVITAPSFGRVHPSRDEYRLSRGGFDTIATITPEERQQLLRLARTLDKMPVEEPRPTAAQVSAIASGRPGDDFNQRANWEEVLAPHGWKYLFKRGETDYLTRPGKTEGVSATINHMGSDLLYVFSSSTSLEANRAYTKFSAYTFLEHGGDFSKAARTLAEKGYGDSGAWVEVSDEPNSWPDPEPLQADGPKVPSLTVDMLPWSLAPWLSDVQERTCFPLEFVAAPAIVGIASVVGGAVGIRPERYDDWQVTPNLWGAIVGPPGSLKTTAVAEGIRPISRLEALARERFEEQADYNTTQQELAASRLAGLQAQVNAAVKRGADTSVFAKAIVEAKRAVRHAEAAQRRYMTHDVTIPKLGELLRDNPRGMLLLRDELYGWIETLSSQGREGDRETFLEMWNGNTSFTFDRIGRGTVYIKSATLSLFGGMQPGKTSLLVQDAERGGIGADGLLQRLQIFVWPDTLGEWKRSTRYPNAAAKSRAFDLIQRLDEMDPLELGAEASGDSQPFFHFNDRAQQLFDEWRERLELRLRNGELELTPAFASHIAKYRSLLPSLALLFHLLDVLDTGRVGRVSAEAVELAIRWCDFLEAHARKLYASELHPGDVGATTLASKIVSGAVKDGDTIRAIKRHNWQHLSTAEAMDDAIEVLSRKGWVRIEDRGTGGRPSMVLRINPQLSEDG